MTAATDLTSRLAEVVGLTGARDMDIRTTDTGADLAITLKGMRQPQAVLTRFRRILERTGFTIDGAETAEDQLRFAVRADPA